MKFLKSKTMTDYEMQLWLDKKGHKLYNPEIDNQVDLEELARLALSYGFKWDEEKQVWIKQLSKIYNLSNKN